jgi:hypothetical protein
LTVDSAGVVESALLDEPVLRRPALPPPVCGDDTAVVAGGYPVDGGGRQRGPLVTRTRVIVASVCAACVLVAAGVLVSPTIIHASAQDTPQPAHPSPSDSPLTGNTPASRPPSASASPSVTPSAPVSLSPTATATATKKTTPSPPAKLLYDPSKTYQLKDGWAGAVVGLPFNNTAQPSGTRVQLWTNQNAPDQYWKISAAPASGYVIITNNLLHKSLAVENDSTSNQSKLIVEDTDKADPNQQWKLTESGDGGKVWITNHHSGKVMDLLGDDLSAPDSDGTWNGYLVEQWSLQTSAKDQRWLLVAS